MRNKKNILSFYTLSRYYDADIERTLKNVYKYADEIVVILNNPRKETKNLDYDIEKKVTFYIKSHTYFADMRNFALSKLHGDWVMWLDSDEIFSEEFLKKIKKYINQTEYDGYKIKRIHFYKTKRQVFDAFSHLRLCRKNPQLRYVGIVHELLMGVSNRKKLRSTREVIYHLNRYEDIVDNNIYYLTLLNKEYEYALKSHDLKLIELAEFRIWCNRNIDNVDNYYDKRKFGNVWASYKRRLDRVLAGNKHYHESLKRLEKAYSAQK